MMREIIKNSDLAKHAEHGIIELILLPHKQILKREEFYEQAQMELNKNIDQALIQIEEELLRKLPIKADAIPETDYKAGFIDGWNKAISQIQQIIKEV